MKKEITIKNVIYELDTEQFIKVQSLGTLIKAIGLTNDRNTYSAFVYAVGEELNKEREAHWVDKINDDDVIQKTITDYIEKNGKTYGVNRKVGIQLGYITKWAEDNGLLLSTQVKVETLYDELVKNPENAVEIVGNSPYSPSTLYQYVLRYISEPNAKVTNKLKSLDGKNKLKVEERLNIVEEELAELKQSVLELQKTK